MNRTRLIIVCESADGRQALPIARVDDHNLLVSAARQVIAEKNAAADKLSAIDNTLGMVAHEEAGRFERTLTSLIPELRAFAEGPHVGFAM